jgi:hypothetical protein
MFVVNLSFWLKALMPGSASAVTMPIKAIVIINSSNVKPDFFFMLVS